MANQLVGNKYTWVIENYSLSSRGSVGSNQFVLGGCKWRLCAQNHDSFKLILQGEHCKPLPSGRRRDARCLLTIVNQNSDKSIEAQELLQLKSADLFKSVQLPFNTFGAKDGGFFVNEELKIVAEIDVTEVDDETSQPIKKIKVENDSATSVKETVDVNGFQVLPSQEELARRIFIKQPDIAVGFRSKNSLLRKACMNSLICLIETLCQSPQGFSDEDLVEANIALNYVKDAGFEVDWLEKKLCQVAGKKLDEQESATRMQNLELELEFFKQKCSDVESLLEKEKAKVVAARAPLTLDDIMN